jgi:hypothetical protein
MTHLGAGVVDLAGGSSSNGRAPDSHSGGNGIDARLLQLSSVDFVLFFLFFNTRILVLSNMFLPIQASASIIWLWTNFRAISREAWTGVYIVRTHVRLLQVGPQPIRRGWLITVE